VSLVGPSLFGKSVCQGQLLSRVWLDVRRAGLDRTNLPCLKVETLLTVRRDHAFLQPGAQPFVFQRSPHGVNGLSTAFFRNRHRRNPKTYPGLTLPFLLYPTMFPYGLRRKSPSDKRLSHSPRRSMQMKHLSFSNPKTFYLPQGFLEVVLQARVLTDTCAGTFYLSPPRIVLPPLHFFFFN